MLGHLLLLFQSSKKLWHTWVRIKLGSIVSNAQIKNEELLKYDLSQYGIEAVKPESSFDLFMKLERKLEIQNANDKGLATYCYDMIFRNESYIGAHPSTASLSFYINPSSGRVEPPVPAFETAENRLSISILIVCFYAEKVFEKLGLESIELDSIRQQIMKLHAARVAVWNAVSSTDDCIQWSFILSQS